MAKRGLVMGVLVTVLLLIAPLVVLAGKPSSINPSDNGIVSISNELISINVGVSYGSAIVGTTGGDPGYDGDENMSLLYGYWSPTSSSSTGYASVRVISGGRTTDAALRDIVQVGSPRVQGKSTIANWVLDNVAIEQKVSLSNNPFTGREDMALWEITLTNQGTATVQAGARLMLDLDIASNDYAPLLVPGDGRLNTEKDFGANLTHFRAFADENYADDSLRALGILKGFGLTDPDRVVLASWSGYRGGGLGIHGTSWDYTVTPGALVGDSAMAYWWNPEALAPGESRTYRTQYGLGEGGGRAWFDAPNAVTCEEPAFDATLWVSNSSIDTLTNVQAALVLPPGLALVSGDLTVSLPDVPADGASSATWRLIADPSDERTIEYSAIVTYDGLAEPITVTQSIDVPRCVTPTPIPSSTPTATPTPMPTLTPTVTATPTITPQPQSLCYYSGQGEILLPIDRTLFEAYRGASASGSTLGQIPEPPAPVGWKNLGFAPGAAWEPAAAVWWPEWTGPGWQPVPENATIIGLRRANLPLGQDGVTQLIRREFELVPPADGWSLARAELRTWSDNKSAWWWQGQCVQTDREGPGGTVDLLPYTARQGGHYVLAIQNSNDTSLPYGNPHGTAYELCVTWAWSGQTRRIVLPLLMR